MKKSLVFFLVATFVLGIAGTALAFPIDFSGDVRIQGRSLDDGVTFNGVKVNGDKKETYFQFRTRLNFKGQIDDNTAFFGRFSARNKLGAGQDQVGTGTGELDQYGVKMTTDNWAFKLGRQAVTLGQGAIISTGYDAAGIDNKFDGAVISTKAGNFDINIIAGKTTNDSTLYNSSAWAVTGAKVVGTDVLPLYEQTGGWITTEVAQWYGLDLSTKLDDKVTLGAAYAHRKGDSTVNFWDPKNESKGRNIWAVNATFNPSSNLSFNGEYAKSDQTTLNKAYFLAGTYSWDKDSFSIQYQKVDAFGADPINSGIGFANYCFKGAGILGADSYKAWTYSYSHQMSKNASFHIIYMDLKPQGDGFGGNDKEIMTGVRWAF